MQLVVYAHKKMEDSYFPKKYRLNLIGPCEPKTVHGYTFNDSMQQLHKINTEVVNTAEDISWIGKLVPPPCMFFM